MVAPMYHDGCRKMTRQRACPGYHLLLIPLLLFALIFCPAIASSNGTETLITTDTIGISDSNPAIYGDTIVCEEAQEGSPSVLDMYNLTTGEKIRLPVKNPSYYQNQPAIGRNSVIWQEYDGTGSAQVVRYDIANRTIQDAYHATYYSDPWGASEFTFPKTDGKTIVWQNYNETSGNWDVAAVRPGWTAPKLILSGLHGLYDEKHPGVYGNSVVYENWTDAGHAFIWRFNLSNNTAVPVSTSSDRQELPSISGTRIAWQARNTTDTKSHVEIWENGITTRLTPLEGDQEKPSLYGDRVVVEDYRRRSSIPEVYVYEYTTSWKESYIAPNNFSASQKKPAVWNNRIVWEDWRSDNACGGCDSDIHLFTLGSPDICPVADFSPSANAGPNPLSVVFTNRSAGSPVLYYIWNYRNGTSSFPLNPVGQLFTRAGVYHTQLTIGNTKCRNTTPPLSGYDIYVDSPPDADITANTTEGFSPMVVQFTDTSGGVPASWTWDFGDGSFSHDQNPIHIYTTAGRWYNVSLTVNNTFGSMASDTEIKTEYIRTFLNSRKSSTIPVRGITVIPRYGQRFLLYNATMLPDMARPLPTVLTAHRPGSAGWQNITFLASDTAGFADTFGNATYMGNLSSVIFQTETVKVSAVSPRIGTGWGVSYRISTPRYPSPASISTVIWEDATTADKAWFLHTIIDSNFVENPDGIAYTARITKNGFPPSTSGNATLNMSVDSSWIGGRENQTYVIGYGNNSQGDTIGSILKAKYLFSRGSLDYFEAEVPDYFTTFGISPLSGSGNIYQLITLSVATHLSPPEDTNPSPDSDSESTGGGSAGRDTVPAKAAVAASTPAPEATGDPGQSAKLSTDARGMVTQVTRLLSTDKRAAVTIGKGVLARDAGGKPLSAITLKALPPGSVPAVPSGSAFTFAGMAYEFGPDQATFSPAIPFTFTLTEKQQGQDYTVQSYDKKSGTWQDLPTTYDATTGTVTAQVSHLCCLALFSQSRAPPTTRVSMPVQTPVPTQHKAQPPTTAVSIFTSMMGWAAGLVAGNAIVIVIIFVLVIAVFIFRQGKFPGSGR
jgi:PKD repeat protein